MTASKPIADCRRDVRSRLHVPEDVTLAVSIERFDYTKGILDRMRAVESFLKVHPERVGKFCLVQAVAPTRSRLPAYRQLQEDAQALADDVNSKYGQSDCPSIQLVVKHQDQEAVYELFRANT